MKTIFIPTDLSSHALVALRYALELSKEAQTQKIIYFHLNPQIISPEIPVLYLDDLNKINADIKKHLETELSDHIENAGIGDGVLATEVVVVTEAGSSTSILEYARKHHSDLIVMGTHGKTGFEKFIFGSVTASVLENSKIPVLVIPRNFHYKPIEKIAFSSALTSFTSEIKSILPFCKTLEAKLEVIHINYGLFSEKLIEHAKRVIHEIGHEHVDLQLLPANLEEKLIDMLKKQVAKKKPEWLVMIPKKREWYEKLFLSSKSLELAIDYNKPVLILHPAGN